MREIGSWRGLLKERGRNHRSAKHDHTPGRRAKRPLPALRKLCSVRSLHFGSAPASVRGSLVSVVFGLISNSPTASSNSQRGVSASSFFLPAVSTTASAHNCDVWVVWRDRRPSDILGPVTVIESPHTSVWCTGAETDRSKEASPWRS